MKPPKTIHTKFRTYNFIRQVNDKLFLYEDAETKSKMTFSKFELGMINNEEIDEVLEIKPKKENKILVLHDKLTDRETEVFHTQQEIADYIGASYTAVNQAIKDKKWIKNRYFIEYKEAEDERN